MSTKEAMDLGGNRRRGSAPKAGSVWESRMKIDEVKGGIKVFNATHDSSQENTQNISSSTNSSATTVNNSEFQMDKTVPKQSPIGKRKTWKSKSLDGSPVKIASLRSELSMHLDESSKELSVSVEGMKKSTIPVKKTRSLLPHKSSYENQKNAIQLRKVKSDFTDVTNDNKIEGNSKFRKVKSEATNGSCNGNLKNLTKNLEKKDFDEKIKNFDVDNVVAESKNVKSGVEVEKSRSDEDCKDVVCEEKAMTSNVGQIKIVSDDDFANSEDEADLVDEDEEEKVEAKNKNHEITAQDHKPKQVVNEEKILLHNNGKTVPISPFVRKQPPPAVTHARFHPAPTKINQFPDNFQEVPRPNSKLQSFVDLVMWRDVSKTAFVFGIGTFAIISSSYTKDLNISFISVLSYLGLVYLSAMFLFRSLISRGSMEMDNANKDCVAGEEEAIWVVRLILPYINEFLLKLRALFSGDPATTMKLAVVLFILARCGSSITIWKMAKLGFIGVFTVPKVCSTYSSQLTAYGTFWIKRFGDAWESCSHKKAVGFAIFTLTWNMSSVVARIWAVFMLFVGFKYYQQSLIKDGWAEEASTNSDNSSWRRQGIRGQQLGRKSEARKQKKAY